jgi:hypothetical protein
MVIPDELIMTANKLADNSMVKQVLNQENEVRNPFGELIYFILYLLIKKNEGKNNKHRPYLESLQCNFDNYPIFFSESDRNELQGTGLLDIILKNKLESKEIYRHYSDKITGFNKFDLQDFREAIQLVNSNQFY